MVKFTEVNVTQNVVISINDIPYIFENISCKVSTNELLKQAINEFESEVDNCIDILDKERDKTSLLPDKTEMLLENKVIKSIKVLSMGNSLKYIKN